MSKKNQIVTLHDIEEHLLQYFEDLKDIQEAKDKINKKYSFEKDAELWPVDDICKAWKGIQQMKQRHKRQKWSIVIMLQILKQRQNKDLYLKMSKKKQIETLHDIEEHLLLYFEDLEDIQKAKNQINKKYSFEKDAELWPVDDIYKAWKGIQQRKQKNIRQNWSIVIMLQILKQRQNKSEYDKSKMTETQSMRNLATSTSRRHHDSQKKVNISEDTSSSRKKASKGTQKSAKDDLASLKLYILFSHMGTIEDRLSLSNISGFFPCRTCAACKNNTKKTTSFTCSVTDQTYSIKQFTTCLTSNVVYLITCPCAKQYVGKTNRAIKTRIIEHNSAIRRKDEKSPIAKHFSDAEHPVSSLSFTIIEHVKPTRKGGDLERKLLQRECFWISTLRTLHPGGLNKELNSSCFL